MGDKLPFLVEYAKTGRSSCKACKTPISKDVLRIAKVVQSPFHDGTMTNWFHDECFYTKARPQKVEEFANFDNIRWEDQEAIRAKIAGGAGAPGPSNNAKGRKRPANPATKDYKIEYAKSNRSTCIGCEAPIIKGDLRISRMDFDSEKAVQLGGIDRWHHLDCFAKIRDTYEFFAAGTSLPGYNGLGASDKDKVKKALPKKKEAVPAKKAKVEPVDNKMQEQMRKQNDALFQMRDKLKDLGRAKLLALLNTNSQFIPSGMSELMDHIADQMLFGALGRCPVCNGNFIFVSAVGYKCMGDLSEWTKCENVMEKPPRVPFKLPASLQNYETLEDYKPTIGERVFRVALPSTSQAPKKDAEEETGPKVDRGPLPLKGMQFVIVGKTGKSKEALRKKIMALGGMVNAKVTENTSAVIANEETLEKQPVAILDAQSHDIQVVTEDFVEEAKSFKDAPITLITKKNIASWGGDPATRVNASLAKSMSRGKSMFEKASSGKVKIKVKGGGAVDPASELEDVAHVYQDSSAKYTVTLGLTNIQSSTNKFYKMQILKHDTQNKYWLFRNWGRIGTTIGGKKLDSLALEDCIKKFEEMYLDKTGNHWRNRHNFQKKPELMYPLDVDVDEEVSEASLESDIASKLQQPVQDLVKLIFDVNLMKKVMAEYELDADKMPLGKLSKTQLQQAYGVLTQLQEAIQKPNPPKPLIVDATNRFYTLVPHSTGISNPPLLDNEEIIKTKSEMIDALLEMEIAYSMLSSKTEKDTNPIDSHYSRLNASIDVLDRNSDEFRLIETYAKNTHAATHSSYELVIEEVFVVKRQGEDKRYKPFKKLHNRQLLWHGSRTTNFAGILSQGLRIAPPEAPVTGYMFGKGIYFADMVSKSANYCCTSSQNSTGLLLLCEVALGNMLECTSSEYVEKLPAGKHSTVGLGQTKPDPSMSVKTKDGVEVPCGTPISSKIKSSLLYDEFIVYDVAQVHVKYLVKMDFKYKW